MNVPRNEVRVVSGVRVRVIPLKRAESILAIARDPHRILENTRRVLHTLEAEEERYATRG